MDVTHRSLERAELLLLRLLVLVYLLRRLRLGVLELLHAICGRAGGQQAADSVVVEQTGVHWRACCTILAASFSASRSVWMPWDCCAACAPLCQRCCCRTGAGSGDVPSCVVWWWRRNGIRTPLGRGAQIRLNSISGPATCRRRAQRNATGIQLLPPASQPRVLAAS